MNASVTTEESEDSQPLLLKSCPKCKTPIKSCMRVMNQIKICQQDLINVKRKILFNGHKNLSFQDLNKRQRNLVNNLKK